MPLPETIDYNEEETWKNVIRENIFTIRQAYEADKFILYRNLNVPLLFWKRNRPHIRLSLTLDGDKIICHSETYKDPIEIEMPYRTFQSLICENSH